MRYPKRILNLGAGTQSSWLYAEMCDGTIPPADLAIFSDTGWEPQAVYNQLAWLKSWGTIPIIEVTAGNIRTDALRSRVRGIASEGHRWASMPLYTLRVWQPSEVDEFEAAMCARIDASHDGLWGPVEDFGSLESRRMLSDLRRGIPVRQAGQITRQCTSEYKLIPIEKYIRTEILGLAHGERYNGEDGAVQQVFGISFDERTRMRTPHHRWSTFDYPLVDRRMRRDRVIELAAIRFPGRIFPRSACLGCPYHSNAEWRALRDNDPIGWADACEVDRLIRDCCGMRGRMFLHRSCVPLWETDLSDDDASDFMFGMQNECIGMCGT